MPSPRDLFKKAYTSTQEMKFEDAKRFYREVLALDTHYSMAWNNLGWILYDQDQQYVEAEKCYKFALKNARNANTNKQIKELVCFF